MAFDSSQLSYRDFRDTLKQRTSQVVVWAGAGMSADAGLPMWPGLCSALVKEAQNKAQNFPELAPKINALLTQVKATTDLWEAFGCLREALGSTSYPASIRAAFEGLSNSEPPILYRDFWSLGIKAFLTLNIDRFASRAFSLVNSGQGLREFDGVAVGHHLDVFRSGAPFVANLHGNIDNHESWVFTSKDFRHLIGLPGYTTLIETCFASRTILFAGISAEDQAAGGHLERLRKMGINLGGHFWLTNRNDPKTNEWAEETGIRQIIYGVGSSGHSQIREFIADLKKYVPTESPVDPIRPTPVVTGGLTPALPPPEVIESLKPNQIRMLLNAEALRILEATAVTKWDEYKQFWRKYEDAIHRAWFISTSPDKNMLFEYVLQDVIATGAFGYVYKAVDPKGKHVAVKILKGNVTEEPEMLEAFRRGVTAMKILSDNGVEGMIPYIAAWEIPACTVMEWVDGPNLEQAVDSQQIDTWQLILRIAIDLVTVIRKAHQLPQRVLHRDIRPANIMLKNWDISPDKMEVVVLDFDLSWHRDAYGQSVSYRSHSGYLAPEQIDATQKKLTRNALVDSYGVGMTLFFLAGGKHPRVEQHNHPHWDQSLKQNIEEKACPSWVSLPKRYSRLVKWATLDKQNERWDLTRINGELQRLTECLKSPSRVLSLELLCEEIACRCKALAPIYTWDITSFSAIAELNSGFSIRLKPQEVDSGVGCIIEWMHMGDRSYKDVKKYVGPASEKAGALLKSGQWKINQRHVAHDRCRIEALIEQGNLSQATALTRAAEALDQAVNVLRFD